MKHISIIIFLILLVLFDINGNSNNSVEHKPFQFEYLTIDQGLTNNRVQYFSQDSSGYIWIATGNGVNKYNGYEVINYMHNPLDSNTILSNNTQFTFVDSKNNVWVGSSGGLNLYNREKDIFVKFIHPDLDNEISTANDIAEDSLKNVWIGTNNGLCCYNLESGEFQQYLPENNIGQTPNSISVRRLYIDNENKILCTFSGNGFSIFNPEIKTFRHFVNEAGNPESISDNQIERIYQDKKGNIWIGTFNGGLNLFNPVNSTFKRYIIDETNSFSTRVRAIFEDPQGNLFFGTRNGIYLMDKTTQNFIHVAHTFHPYSILSMNSILNSYIDKQGGLWIGTYSGGINYTNLYRKPFLNFGAKKDNPFFLNNSNVYAILEDNKGDLYIGTEGGMSFLNRETGKFTHFIHNPDDPNSISHNDIKCLELDANNNLWIGTNKGGLLQYNPRTGKFFNKLTHDPDNNNSISSNSIYNLFNDKNGNIWILFREDFVDIYNPVSMQFKHLNLNSYSGFCENKDYILFGASDGFWKYEYKTDSFTFFNNDSLIGVTYSILEDSKKKIWIGANDGLVSYNPETNKYFKYSVKNGYPFYDIYGVLEDSDHNLWLSSNSGLIKFMNVINDKDSKNFVVFDQNDGLQSKQFNYGAFYQSTTGEMFFGGINGFNSFFPDQIKNNPFYPEVVFTNLKINNKLVCIDEEINGRIVLNKAFSETKQIILKPKDDIITIEFAAIHFAQPEKNRYKYMMEGFDEEWYETDASRNFVTYSNLPQGEYIFKLLGSNNDGLWIKTPKELKIIVLPPFWKTWWFFLIIAVIIFFAIRFYITNREKALKEEKNVLESKIQEAVDQVEEKKQEIESQNQALLEKHKEDEIRNWASEGMARFGDLLREGNENLEAFCYTIISELAEFLEAQVGALFIRNDDNPDDVFYEIKAAIAYGKKKVLKNKIGIGEGLIGSCAFDKKTIYYTEIPEDYVKISSGLGEIPPKCLIIVPCVFNEDVFAIIEMASLELFEDYKINFLEELGEKLASTVSIVKNNESTNRLLKKSKEQANELITSEEELRQNLEEMRATQEQSDKREKDLTEEIEVLKEENTSLRKKLREATSK